MHQINYLALADPLEVLPRPLIDLWGRAPGRGWVGEREGLEGAGCEKE